MIKIYAIKKGDNELWSENLENALVDFNNEVINSNEKFELGENDKTDKEELTFEIKYVTQEEFDKANIGEFDCF